MSVGALIVAAGRGERTGGGTPKQYRSLLGRPVLRWSIDAFARAGVGRIVVAIAPEHADVCRLALEGAAAVQIVNGGASRTDSVRAALASMDEVDVVLVHDAARPGVTADVIHALVAAITNGAAGAAPALPIVDTLRRTDAHGNALEDVDRNGLLRVQTPQAFRLDALRAAYAALPHQAAFSDDMAIERAHGGNCVLIPGDARLMKITHAEDFAVMEKLLAGDLTTCVGAGIDAHRFGAGEHVTLCGVRIPHDKGLVGHSDADAGWHALVDAILGALGEGDIGAHFPPSDPRWRDADSQRFLEHAVELAEKTGARIIHVDVTLVCERPKVGPHREAMRARTAEVLGLPISRVSVKATTTERMGFLGREEGLAAYATATVLRPA